MKDILIRALKTFWQGSIAYLITAFGTQLGAIDLFSVEALKEVGVGLLIGALAAGLSATWNGVIAPIVDKYKVVTPHESKHVCDDADCDSHEV